MLSPRLTCRTGTRQQPWAVVQGTDLLPSALRNISVLREGRNQPFTDPKTFWFNPSLEMPAVLGMCRNAPSSLLDLGWFIHGEESRKGDGVTPPFQTSHPDTDPVLTEGSTPKETVICFFSPSVKHWPEILGVSDYPKFREHPPDQCESFEVPFLWHILSICFYFCVVIWSWKSGVHDNPHNGISGNIYRWTGF